MFRIRLKVGFFQPAGFTCGPAVSVCFNTDDQCVVTSWQQRASETILSTIPCLFSFISSILASLLFTLVLFFWFVALLFSKRFDSRPIVMGVVGNDIFRGGGLVPFSYDFHGLQMIRDVANVLLSRINAFYNKQPSFSSLINSFLLPSI